MADVNQFERLASAAFNAKELDLILLPTEKCNFRCTYCYESFELGRMTTDLVNSILKLIEIRSPTLNLLKLNWFGGEPLLAKTVVYRIMDEALNICTRYKVDIFSEMTTNGFLLDQETFQNLIDRGGGYKLSDIT